MTMAGWCFTCGRRLVKWPSTTAALATSRDPRRKRHRPQVGQYRPLLFFGVPGMVVLLIGMGWGVYVVELYRRHGGLAVGYAMISILLAILGSLSLFAGIILHSVRGLLLELVGPGSGESQVD